MHTYTHIEINVAYLRYVRVNQMAFFHLSDENQLIFDGCFGFALFILFLFLYSMLFYFVSVFIYKYIYMNIFLANNDLLLRMTT